MPNRDDLVWITRSYSLRRISMMRTVVSKSFILVLICWTLCGSSKGNPLENLNPESKTAPGSPLIKSRSLIPFPRVGRSRPSFHITPTPGTVTISGSSSSARERNGMREFKRHLIPFPRVGKRQSLIPFPRVGRNQLSPIYINNPNGDVSPDDVDIPADFDTGLLIETENGVRPIFDFQGYEDHPVYGQLRWQPNSQEQEK